MSNATHNGNGDGKGPDNGDLSTAEAANGPSLATRILQLQQEHRSLDLEIEELYAFPYRDQLHLQRLKKKKLQIKDTIARLKDELIPDLNA